MKTENELLQNIQKLHTTPMGIDRIRRNLGLGEDVSDVVEFFRNAIRQEDCQITRQGKNWYCEISDIIITVNAYSYTIITAHKAQHRHCERSAAIHNNRLPRGYAPRNDAKRPAFDDIKSFEEFSKYYWYREELIKICRALGLKCDGGKIELNKIIEAYFKASRHPELVSGSLKKKIPKQVRDDQSIILTLDTCILECGFTFGPRFREFFIEQTGITNFKFNVDMVATARKVKENHDTNFTLGDLLDIYYGKKSYAKYDKVSLQWNKFVHDFCADPATKEFPNKLKTAAALWKQVRESTREKVYTSELLSSLRAKRGNPHKIMDCHVANAPRNDEL